MKPCNLTNRALLLMLVLIKGQVSFVSDCTKSSESAKGACATDPL